MRQKNGEGLPNEVLTHILYSDIAMLLMYPHLDHSQHKTIFSEVNVGYRLERAGLVHMLCPVQRKPKGPTYWFLVVANFIDMSFDILNPERDSDKILTQISAVVNNFKMLFIASYPHCPFFNIQSFGIRHMKVPKLEISESVDTGIYVWKYFTTYNGIETDVFSKLDVQALRENFVFQLLSNKYNRIKLPFVKDFLEKHGLDKFE